MDFQNPIFGQLWPFVDRDLHDPQVSFDDALIPEIQSACCA